MEFIKKIYEALIRETAAKTRAEHLQWCKDRALQYANKGDIKGAFTSFQSDMNKHPETANHIALEMGVMLLVSGHLSSVKEMSDWINGFN